MTDDARSPKRSTVASLSGEVSDLLIELGSAFQKFGMYPEGHPALEPAVKAVESRLSAFLGTRRTLALGVGRDEILVEGVPTDSSHPLFKNLATRLYRHEIGAVTFAEGVTSEEIAQVLRLFASDPERTGRTLGSEPESVLRGRPHVHLEPARYAELKLKARSSLSKEEQQAKDHSLWRSLADSAATVGADSVAEDGTAVLHRPSEAAREVTDIFRRAGVEADSDAGAPVDSGPPGSGEVLDPEELAKRLAEFSDDVDFDRTMGRQMAEIARSLATLDPDESSDLRDRFTELLADLDPATLQRVMSMGGDDRARRQFLLDAVKGVGADAVLTLIRAASEDSSSDISRWMLRLLTKMAAHTDEGAGTRPMQSRARHALRDQVTTLLADWDLDNPNPEEYETALGRLAMNSLGSGGGSDMRAGLEPDRLAQMSLETEMDGEILAQAVDQLVNAGRTRELVQWIDQAPGAGAANPATLHVWDRLAEPAVVRRLVEEEEPDYDCLDRVLPLAGLDAAEPLLDRLATADSISLRRGMFDRITALGPEAGPLAAERLKDPETTPWFVLRNILALMGALPRWPDDFDPALFRSHETEKVRYEALRLSMRLSHQRPEAILEALREGNGRIQALGVVEAEAGAPPEAEPLLRAAALDPTEDAEVRLPAIRALGRFRTDTARDALIQVLDIKRKLLGGSEIEASPEKLTALRTLVAWWPSDGTVRRITEIATGSASAELMEAVDGRLAAESRVP